MSDTKDSTPVTFSALLAHHRRLAEDPRADRAWHAEAVECMERMAGGLGCHECGASYDDTTCDKADCPIWQAVEVKR